MPTTFIPVRVNISEDSDGTRLISIDDTITKLGNRFYIKELSDSHIFKQRSQMMRESNEY